MTHKHKPDWSTLENTFTDMALATVKCKHCDVYADVKVGSPRWDDKTHIEKPTGISWEEYIGLDCPSCGEELRCLWTFKKGTNWKYINGWTEAQKDNKSQHISHSCTWCGYETTVK